MPALMSTAGQEILDHQGPGRIRLILMDEALLLKVHEALADELLVVHVIGDSRTAVFGHVEAGLVDQVAPEEGPGPAEGRLVAVHGTAGPGLKEDAGLIPASGLQDPDIPVIFSVFPLERLQGHPQELAQPLLVSERDHDPALTHAALPAHLADKRLLVRGSGGAVYRVIHGHGLAAGGVLVKVEQEG